MAIYDRRVLGQTNSLSEKGVDLNRMRQMRLAKVQEAMAAQDIGALLLTDIINIRYVTGVSVMPLWTATNLAHYVFVPVEGSPVIFEFSDALFRAEEFWPDVRPAYYWQTRFAGHLAGERSGEWAAKIKDVMKERGLAHAKLGIDTLDFHGFSALQKQGLTLTDADDPLQAARVIKTMDEIELLRLAATVGESALYDLQQAIRPGITENELLATFWHRMLVHGGEWCFTRLITSGHKTNPWYQEAGSKMVRPGDLVAIDTDMIGPEGYVCDVSRTFLCGDKPTANQKEAYRVAYDFVKAVIELCKPGMSYAELAANIPKIPDAYKAQRYSVILHGIGTDDEPPAIPFPDKLLVPIPEGELKENMVVSVEFYAGKVGAQDGVKLEDEVWVSKDGPVVLSHYPYEEKLLA